MGIFGAMLRSRTLPIYATAGLMFAGLAARNFILPLRVHELGGGRAQVGLLFSLFMVTAAGLSLPAGLLADRIGRKAMVVFSAIVVGVSQLGLALSPSVGPMYFWQLLAGLGGGAQAGLFAALVDAAPRGRLGRSMGWLTLAMQSGFLIGPATTGFALAWFSLQTTLAASTLVFAGALVLTLVGIRSGARPNVSWNLAAALGQVARRPGFGAAVTALLGATLVFGTLQAYLPLFAKEQLRLPETQIGYMIAIQAIFNGLARLPGGRVVDRAQRRWPLIVVCVAAYAASVALVPHLTGFWPVTAAVAGTVPLIAVSYIAISVAFSTLATEETRGVAMGVYTAVLFAGLGLGPAAFGAVMQGSGYVAGFTACALAGIALALVTALLQVEPMRRALLLPQRGGR